MPRSLTTLFVSVLSIASAAQGAEAAWITESNQHTQVLLEVNARYQPESAADLASVILLMSPLALGVQLVKNLNAVELQTFTSGADTSHAVQTNGGIVFQASRGITASPRKSRTVCREAGSSHLPMAAMRRLPAAIYTGMNLLRRVGTPRAIG